MYTPLALGLRVLLRHVKRTRINEERTRGQYIIAGMGAMLIGGTTDYLPSLGVVIYPLGIIGNIFFCVLATVAMLRYNLLDARAVLRKGTAYSLVSMFILGVFGTLLFGLSAMYRELGRPVSLTIAVATVFVAAAVFQPVLSGIQRVVDRWFFRQRYDHIQALKRFTRQRKGGLDLQQLSSSLTAGVLNAMGSRGVYLLMPAPATGDLENYASCGQQSAGRMSFAASSPLVVTMKYQDGPVDIGDIDIIPSLSGLADDDRQLLMQNGIELLLPLKSSGGLVGILLLGGKTSGEPYSNEDRELLRTVSDSVAVTMENARQYESVKKERGELRKAVEGVIHAVSLVVEIRDPYTAGHQKRVAELARAIAREMGLSEWQVTGIYIAGLLHDVGKVAVPAEILSKPGKLSEYEFRLIKDHPRVGHGILERIEFPWPVTKVVLQHHERLDGSGYPDGISGDEITLEARILAVADVVEAISSHRPYRPALGLGNALDEIAHQTGILYDSAVVEACLRLFKNTGADLDALVAVAAAREGAALTI